MKYKWSHRLIIIICSFSKFIFSTFYKVDVNLNEVQIILNKMTVDPIHKSLASNKITKFTLLNYKLMISPNVQEAC